MSRIISYPYDNNIKAKDAWVGTDDASRKTKQYTAEALAKYLNISGSISIVGQMTYKYVTEPLSDIGTLSVFGGGPNIVAFSAVSKLTLSNQDISGQRVVEFLDLLVGSNILIAEQEAISTFGYYSIDSYAANATDTNYYDLSVTFKSGNGSMEDGKVYEAQNFTLAAEENIDTLQTTIDAGNTYQASPSDTLWTWGTEEITATSTSFTSLLSSKRFKTTFITNGTYTDILPNNINFYNSLGSLTTLRSSSTAVAAAINLELPSSSGILALTTDIISSPWDAVSLGINYSGGSVGIGTTSPLSPLHVTSISSGPAARFINTSGTGGNGAYIQGGNSSSSNILVLSDYQNNERLRVRGDGNVGIGTTNPNAKLQVAGDIRADYNVIFSGTGFINNNTGSLQLETVGNKDILLSTNGTGNVGIGTINPGSLLHVEGNRTTAALQINQTGTGVIANFKQGGSSKVIIDNSGHVGIGTTSPVSKTHIVGTANNNTLKALTLQNDSPAGDIGSATETALDFIHTDQNTTSTSYARARISTKQGTTANDGFDSEAGGDLLFHTALGSAQNTGTLAERMRINDAGNVGIGTTSPSEALDVAGNIKAQTIFIENASGYDAKLLSDNLTANKTFQFPDNDGTLALTSDIPAASQWNNVTGGINYAGGNVGIGTTNPGQKLDVNGNISIALASGPTAINQISMVGSRASFGYDGSISSAFMRSSDTSKPLVFGSGANEFMRIVSSTGNVGIGTTSPLLKLSVGADGVGLDLPSTSTLGFYTTNSERMRITSTGNVGIGNTNPVNRLDVQGNVSVVNLKVGSSASQEGIIRYNGGSGNGIGITTGNLSAAGIGLFVDHSNNSRNVGIGTTNPNGLLHVSSGTSGDAVVIIESDTDNNNENDNPQLQFKQDGGATIAKIGLTGDGAGTDYTNSLINAAYFGNDELAALQLYTDATARLTIEPNGDVGIGTNNPGAKLEVSGGIKVGADSSIFSDGSITMGIDYNNNQTDRVFNIIANNTTERFRVQENGNVGIGTTNPSYKLHVEGAIGAKPLNYKYIVDTNQQDSYPSGVLSLSMPLNGYLWHDLFAFDYNYTRTQEVSVDGTTWGPVSLDRDLFIQKQDQSVGVIGSGEQAVRWTFQGVAWSVAGFLNVAFTWTSPSNSKTILVETSTNGVTWTTRHTSTASSGIATKTCYLSYYGGDNFMRITIAKATTNTDIVKLSSLRLMTARAGDQGQGMENHYPYTWDADKTITTGAIRTTSNNVSYINGNLGIGTTSPSEKLEVNGARSSFNGILIGENNSDIQFLDDGKLNVGNNDWLITREGSQEVMRAGGADRRVGIGTTSPVSKTHIVGTANNNTLKALTLQNDSPAGDIGSSTETALDFIHTDINTTSTSYARARISTKQGTTANDGFDAEAGGDLLFYTALGSAQNTGTLTERMRINDAGNVGVGTASPASKLEVDGGDIEVNDSARGLILRSPDGTRYRITVANGGTLTVAAV